jgi:hypothetical protein
MKFLEGYRRIASIVILVLPHLATMLGHPIGGEDIAPVVNGISDLLAAVLVAWSKLKPSAP